MSETKTVTHPQEAGADFTSTIAWEDRVADVVVISCSDHRFRRQTDEFLEHLGYKMPHVIKFPAGPVLLNPLVASLNIFTKAVEHLLEKALAAAKGDGKDGPMDVICITHERCAAYKAGGVKLVDFAARHMTGRSVKDLQVEHLKKTSRRIATTFRNVRVKAYFAEIVEEKQAARFDRIEF